MIAATQATLYCGAVLYLAATVFAVVFLRTLSKPALRVASRLTWCAGMLYLLAFLLRWATWRLLPLTTMGDSLVLFVLLSTVIALWVTRNRETQPLLAFFLPLVAVVCLAQAGVVHTYSDVGPRALRGAFLTAHVGSAFLAYALFFVASITSAAYLFQVYQLKRHQTSGLFQRLPSLEQLDQLLVRLTQFGFPAFLLTVVLGGVWAHVDRYLLAPRWWLSPKVLGVWFTLAVYATALLGRSFGWLRGRRLAYVVAVGSAIILAAYVVLAALQLRNLNFWGPAT